MSLGGLSVSSETEDDDNMARMRRPENQCGGCYSEVKESTPGMTSRSMQKSWRQEGGDCVCVHLENCPSTLNLGYRTGPGHAVVPAVAGDGLCSNWHRCFCVAWGSYAAWSEDAEEDHQGW